ncbi:MAG: N-6 DNA methylase, partial [Paludibacter sp.]|nr:N-6 DNA methylase [Paludibacter sp.]
KGRAFETFMGSFFRGSFGQYFTPRQIVKFTIDVLPITNNSIVMDTSCGSGGFLLYALNKVREQATELYPKYKTDTRQYAKWFTYWHDFAAKNLYGIEINEQISRAAKMNMIMHDDGHTNVITSDGLLSPQQIEERTSNNGFQYGRVDFIVTNPPFGSIVKLTEQAYLKNYSFGKKQHDWLDLRPEPDNESDKEKRDNQSTEVLFIEQAYKFLKPHGYLAIVVPDGILTNSSLQYVRDSIEEWFRIVAVISMPQTAFSANGAGVKSSVMILRKWTDDENKKIVTIKKSIAIDLRMAKQYREKVKAWEKEKKAKQKALDGFENTTGIKKLVELRKTPEYKNWSAELSATYTTKVNELKDELNEAYLKERQMKLPDYPIFMAIADVIGYDATGKPTTANELDYIGKELSKFIVDIEGNEK